MPLSGFIAPSLPSKVARPPSGPLWVHELKHDGYRLMVRKDGARVDVMRLDQTLGPLASRCLRIKLYVDENFP
jgi:hypothetical protein